VTFQINKTIVRLIKADITDIDADAIVNAANSSLMGGGGVDGAIHRKGGPEILEECKKIRAEEWSQGLPSGKAVITSAGNLKARYVIHTVGPIWRGGKHGESAILTEAYQNSLALAVSKKLKSISFPSISTGAYGYPSELASQVALKTIKNFLEKESNLIRVDLVLFSERDFKTYSTALEELGYKLPAELLVPKC
jgi:O-acetyl-ADP-ribose deacetylase (regulator of RNase III)